MKNLISETDKIDILLLHEKHKRKGFLMEQDDSIRTRLTKLMKSGCVAGNNLFIQEFTGYSKPEYQFAIAQESTKKPGYYRYLFIDMKIGMFNPSGKWEWVGSWNCDKYISDMEKKEKETDTERIRIAKESGAYTLDEWLRQGVDVKSNMANFEEIVIGSTKLYKRKNTGVTGGSSEKQKEIIDNIRSRGGKLDNEVNDEQRTTWKREQIVAPGGVDFPNGLWAYFPKNEETRTKVAEKYDEVRTNVRLNDDELKKCENNIKMWYEDWANDIELGPSTHTSTKQLVQACVNQLRLNKVKRVFSKTDDYIDKLTGREKPGPLSDDKFRLKPPKI